MNEGIVETVGIDGAGPRQQHPVLALEERMGGERDHPRGGPRRRLACQRVEQRRHARALEPLDHEARGFRCHDLDERRGVAHAVAGAFDQIRVEPALVDPCTQRLEQRVGADRPTASTGLHDHADPEAALGVGERGQIGERSPGGRGRFRDGGFHGQHRRRAAVTPAVAEPALEVGELRFAHAATVLTVHLDRRRHRAREEAVGGLQGHLTVGARCIRCRVEALREFREELASAEKRAGYSGAHAHVMTAVGRQMELGKVRGHAVHLGGGHAEVRGDLGQRVFAEPAVSMLDGLEGGKEPLTLARELREDGIEGFDHEGWGG